MTSRPRAAGAVLAVALAALAAYLALWPVPIAPVAWDAPPPPEDPAFAPNGGFRGLERLGAGVARGGEAIAVDAAGRPYTGTRDGRILRLDPATRAFEEVARTGGRPLGLAFDRSGDLWICDAEKGLLRLAPTGELTALVSGYGGVPFRLTDDVDVGPDGTVYFTDASSRFGVNRTREAILEHGGDGRFLAYHPDTGRTELLLSGLQFANGVAVSGDGSHVLVNETGAYRIVRYWLAGPRRGTAEPFVENLPGLPDNVTWSPSRRAFWVALFSPRVPALDALARHPFLRRVVLRIPRALQPEPLPQAFAVAIGEDGRISAVLRDASPGAFAPVTSVRERDGVLWVGSLEGDGIGRLAAPPPRPVAEGR
ncbi:MAG TPA: SMP-30/gluconolactonase/LRE family protein [Anaeromyxobacter sp.]